MSTMAERGFITLCRVSTREQAERFGLAWQRRSLRPYGERYLGPCLGEYDEGATSTGTPFEARPVLQEMLTDLETLRPGYLLVADQDRIARGDDFALVKRELRRLGVRLAFYREGAAPEVLDLEDEYGDFTSDIFSAVAKLEKRRIVKRMHRGKQEAARRGNAVMPVPYGYWKPEKGKVAIEEERAFWVREIFARLASGEWTIRRLARWLHEQGAPPPRGRAGHWSTSYLARLVKNPAYLGRAQMMGVEVPFPPIVDEAVFERVQEAVRRNAQFSGRNNKRFDYLLRGLIRCGRCGKAVVGRPRHDKPAYNCNGHPDAELMGMSKCDQPRLYAAPIEEAVWAEIEPLLTNPALIREWARSKPALVASEATFLRRRLSRYSERRERLLRQHEYAHIGDKELKARLEEIELERAEAEERLERLEQTPPLADVDVARLEEAERLLAELQDRLRMLSFGEKRYLVERLVRRVVLDGRQVSVEVIVPLAAGLVDARLETA
jgi:site-specific DNA recombinase